VASAAGKLLFSGDPHNNLVARDPATGEALWHTRLHDSVSNGPMTYELDGHQYTGGRRRRQPVCVHAAGIAFTLLD
jgi:glucose dehydrogenase